MRKSRGFTLIELMVVLVILGILLALVTGLLSRYRASTALNQAVDRLVSEIPQAQASARAFGIDQTTSLLNTTANAQTPNSELAARVVQKVAGEPGRVTKEWLVGDTGGQSAGLVLVNSTNLPRVDYALADQGLQLQIGERVNGVFTVLFSIPFQANGEVLTLTVPGVPAASGTVVFGNGYTKQRITISPLGRVTKETV